MAGGVCQKACEAVGEMGGGAGESLSFELPPTPLVAK